MTAIEEAREALAKWDRSSFPEAGYAYLAESLRTLIAEYERLSVPPSDDEREALRDELAGWVIGAGYYQSMVVTSDAAEMADAILAAGFRRQGPITDEMVEAAARAEFEHYRAQRPDDHGPYATWDELDAEYRAYCIAGARAALEAAERVRSAEDPGAHGGLIPRYAMLDIWMALYGHETSEAFDAFYDGAGYAEAWATLCAAIRAHVVLSQRATVVTDDDREALDQIMREADGYWPDAREAILTAGFRRQGPITEALTEKDLYELPTLSIVMRSWPDLTEPDLPEVYQKRGGWWLELTDRRDDVQMATGVIWSEHARFTLVHRAEPSGSAR